MFKNLNCSCGSDIFNISEDGKYFKCITCNSIYGLGALQYVNKLYKHKKELVDALNKAGNEINKTLENIDKDEAVTIEIIGQSKEDSQNNTSYKKFKEKY